MDDSFLRNQWTEFVEACGITRREQDKDAALKVFQAVLTTTHNSVYDFDINVFNALQFVVDAENITEMDDKVNAFVLNGIRVGFASQIDLSLLKCTKFSEKVNSKIFF